MRGARAEAWVVYSMPVRGIPARIRGICEQWEWDAMELARPGVKTLIQAGITNEGEAERLARGSSGEARPRGTRRAITSWPDAAVAILARPAAPVTG